ncbi:MAG: hypothetical protein JW950_06230, partial [Deltaproteobacteria bacterium]|nr:hypothetical protein [Deltaproteobacteria bacterium]
MFQNDRTTGLTQEEKDARVKAFYEEIKEHPYPKPGSGEVPWALAFLKLMAPMIYEKEADTFLAYRREEGIWKPKDKGYLAATLMILSTENPYGAKPIDARKAGIILRHASQHAKPGQGAGLNAEGLLNLVNGMLHPETGELLPHDPNYYSKGQLPVRYDPGATAPRWMRFLEETFYDDPAKALVLQEFFGYTLWREDCRFHKALILIGGGPGGKSVIAKIMLGMMGFDNATTMDTKQITSRFGTALLAGRLVNISTQGFTNLDPIDTEMMKALISGDLVLGEQKFGRSFNFQNRAKFLFVTNSPPYFREDSHGSQRRFLVLTCNRNLPPSKQDPLLSESMWREEIDGIFNWAVEGLKRLLKQDIFTTSP